MIQLPKAEDNIYPLSEENVEALLIHYFPKSYEKLKEKSEHIQLITNIRSNKFNIPLNQVEFVFEFLSKNSLKVNGLFIYPNIPLFNHLNILITNSIIVCCRKDPGNIRSRGDAWETVKLYHIFTEYLLTQ